MGRSRSRSRERSSSKHHKSHKHSKKSSGRKDSRSRSPLTQVSSSSTRVRSRSPKKRSRSPKHRSSGVARNGSPPLATTTKALIDNTTLGGSKRVDYLTLGNIKPKRSAQVPVMPIVDPALLEGKSQDEVEMMKLLGFSSFDSTKGKHVEGACNAGMANIQEKRRYRQYMNRKGGFNRPLDPVL
jgi:U4/U6.U5 tri-snRNP-associated protein 3